MFLSLPETDRTVYLGSDDAERLGRYLSVLVAWYDRDALADTAPPPDAFGVICRPSHGAGLTLSFAQDKEQFTSSGNRMVFLPFGTALAVASSCRAWRG